MKPYKLVALMLFLLLSSIESVWVGFFVVSLQDSESFTSQLGLKEIFKLIGKQNQNDAQLLYGQQAKYQDLMVK